MTSSGSRAPHEQLELPEEHHGGCNHYLNKHEGWRPATFLLLNQTFLICN